MLLKLIDNKELFVGWVRLLSDSEIIVTQHQRFKTLSAGLRSFFYRKKQLTQPTYQCILLIYNSFIILRCVDSYGSIVIEAGLYLSISAQ